MDMEWVTFTPRDLRLFECLVYCKWHGNINVSGYFEADNRILILDRSDNHNAALIWMFNFRLNRKSSFYVNYPFKNRPTPKFYYDEEDSLNISDDDFLPIPYFPQLNIEANGNLTKASR